LENHDNKYPQSLCFTAISAKTALSISSSTANPAQAAEEHFSLSAFSILNHRHPVSDAAQKLNVIRSC
jgi:hypothetical protein